MLENIKVLKNIKMLGNIKMFEMSRCLQYQDVVKEQFSPHHLDLVLDQPLQQVVDGHIGRGADENLVASLDCQGDDLHNGGCFTGAGWPVNYR